MHLEPSSGRHAGLRGTGTPRTPASQRVLAELNASAVFDFHFIQDTDQGKGEVAGEGISSRLLSLPCAAPGPVCPQLHSRPPALLCAAAEGGSWGRQKPQLLLELSSFQLLLLALAPGPIFLYSRDVGVVSCCC